MNHAPRRRHYVSPSILVLLKPLFRYSVARDAYVLRGVGNTRGPVLRRERRRQSRGWAGPDRRHRGIVLG
jgi:hypothetical protein